MTTETVRTYHTVDKLAWGRGPWQDEPDKMQWTDETTGLPCLLLRNGVGALCGYVGVAQGHPAFERDYDNEALWPIEVHGGLTYSDHCQTGPEDHVICHIPEPGQPDHVWWLGFDCAHLGDYCPGMDTLGSRLLGRGEYRTVDYVQAECARLAQQLRAAA